MPGLLFHHETPTKDWYFDEEIEPWIHYVPINEDLSDLREKMEWAENNEKKAKQISRAGTRFVRKLGRPSVLNDMYQKYVLQPLAKVIDAYEQSDDLSLTSLFIEGVNGIGFKEIMKCTGHKLLDCDLP